MFSSVESESDVEQAALVPTSFVWPYGGRQVYITGTFKRLERDALVLFNLYLFLFFVFYRSVHALIIATDAP